MYIEPAVEANIEVDGIGWQWWQVRQVAVVSMG
jgi:hypothetical protein